MTTRAGKPDTTADRELRRALDASPPQSFVVVAGAGSGKTTSLVKALEHVIQTHGDALRSEGRRVACITYTEVAAEEIAKDVGSSEIVHVSTIHSFLWSIVNAFRADIGEWVAEAVKQAIADERACLQSTRTKPESKAKAAEKVDRLELALRELGGVRRWTYGTGSDYANGVLGHSDVLKMVPALILGRPLLGTILAGRFPFVFVDESQDTDSQVVAALKAIQRAHANSFCLGFFGDPMQQIYTTGMGTVLPEEGWATIAKPENFRSAPGILRVTNAIRRPADGLTQASGLAAPPSGGAQIWVLPADDQRRERLERVRERLAEGADGAGWRCDDEVRVLVIVHRMAAARLGFEQLYGVCHDDVREFSDAFDEGTLWVLKPLQAYLLPLAEARRDGDEFRVIALLRRFAPEFAHDNASTAVNAERLAEINAAVSRIAGLMWDASASIGKVLRSALDASIVRLDDALVSAVRATPVPAGDGEVELDPVGRVLRCPAREVLSYHHYIEGQSLYATQHGVKGAEFPRVLVVLDDDEGRYNLYSYEKLLGLRELSQTDKKNLDEGKDNVLARTRRLFYVCCSRAQRQLAVALFVTNPHVVGAEIIRTGIFESSSVHVLDELSL